MTPSRPPSPTPSPIPKGAAAVRTRLRVTSIKVLDQEGALDFYVNKLGLVEGPGHQAGPVQVADRAVPRQPRRLLGLVPDTVSVLRDGQTVTLAAEDIRIGELIVVRRGERIATDGHVRSGRSALDVSAITGESTRVEVSPGATIFAGSVNGGGALEVEASATAQDNSNPSLHAAWVMGE